MALTDTACRNATCPEGKARARFTDGAGLYLEVAPNGSKRWFWKYIFGGKEKRLALGKYGTVGTGGTTLKAAREARDAARRLHAQGIDPVQRRRVDKLANGIDQDATFEAVARECHKAKVGGWSEQYGARWIERMEKDLFPWIGTLGLPAVTAPVLLQTLRRIESRGAIETAHTLRQTAGQVFRYGI